MKRSVLSLTVCAMATIGLLAGCDSWGDVQSALESGDTIKVGY
jgi:hypothetical protein